MNDTTPATVSIASPLNGANVFGTITVWASASDNVNVGVQFTLDVVNLGAELTAAPYAVSWSTTTASNGAHTLTAVPRDTAGNVTIASGASVIVANPTVSSIAPPNGASHANETEVTVQATSSIGPNTIQIYSDSSLIGTVSCTGTSCSDTVDWHTNGLAAGPHSLYAVATATFGNSGSSMAFTVFK